jgi:hypothetical protein
MDNANAKKVLVEGNVISAKLIIGVTQLFSANVSVIHYFNNSSFFLA